MGLSRKPNKYGLDPFLMVDTVKANYYYGRTDVEPDTKGGQARAIISASRGEDPDLDKALPWMLLARGMFKFLYKKELVEHNRRKGIKERVPGSALPHPRRVAAHDWAEAFNIISVRYIQTEFLRQPKIIKKQKTSNGRTVNLAVVVTDPGKGVNKSESYIQPGQRKETINILRRMERHRLELGEDPEVQKHLASLRDPEVRG